MEILKVKEIDELNAFVNNDANRSYIYDLKNRVDVLNKIYQWIRKNHQLIIDALAKDLNKDVLEVITSEIKPVLDLTKTYIKQVPKFYKSKPKSIASVFVYKYEYEAIYKPLGTCLLINPFNYPFHLSVAPLVTALAAGNLVILKNSNKAPLTSFVIYKMLYETNLLNKLVCFLDEFVDLDFIKKTIAANIDHLFFTGGIKFGYTLKRLADANNLKVTLELGSANSVIVDETANIYVASKKVIWAKLFNSGQTCVAPNTCFVNKDKKEDFIKALQEQLEIQYETNKNYTFAKMVDKQALNHVVDIVKKYTGVELETDLEKLIIKPKIIEISPNNPIVFKEVFAPVLFVCEYDDFDELIKNFKHELNNQLSLYFFTCNETRIKQLQDKFNFGSLVINDLLVHASNMNIPFGGVKTSGVGKYHGIEGLKEFSNLSCVIKTKPSVDHNTRYFNNIHKYASFIKKLIG